MEKEFIKLINELYSKNVDLLNRDLLVESTDHLAMIAQRLKKDIRTAPLFKRNTEFDGFSMWEAARDILFSDNKAKQYILDRHLAYVGLMDLNPSRDNAHTFEYVADVVRNFVRMVNAGSKGRLSALTKKELRNWVNGNMPGRHRLSSDTINELNHTNGIRPTHEVVLYRGMLFNSYHLSDERSENAMEILRAIKKGHRDFYLTSTRPSSWTKDEEVGLRFAKYKAAVSNFAATISFLSRDGAIDGELGVLLKFVAEPEDVLVDLNMIGVDSNHGNEDEYIIKAGKHKVHILRVFNKNGEIDIATTQGVSSTGRLTQRVRDAVSSLDLTPEHRWDSYDYGSLFSPAQVEYAFANEGRMKKRYTDIITALHPILSDFDPKNLDALEIDVADSAAKDRFEALRTIVDRLLKANKKGIRLIDSDYHAIPYKKTYISLLDGDHNRALSRLIGSNRVLSFHLMSEKKQKEHLGETFEKILTASNNDIPMDWDKVVMKVNSVLEKTYELHLLSMTLGNLVYQLSVLGAKSSEA